MDTVDLLAIALVSAWLVATMAYQHPRLRPRLSRFDPFRLLPAWSFFAPHPVTRDNHVVVRGVLEDGTVTPWCNATRFPARSWRDAVWNPSKRPQKVLRDASRSLKIMRGRSGSPAAVECSLAYLLVLHACRVQPAVRDAVALQFAIVETSGHQDRAMWITFVSRVHPL